MNNTMALAVLWVLVMVSAFAVVATKHESRQLFIEKVALDKQRDELNVEWGRLQLEQNTWAAHGRVEPLARKELNMRMPKSNEIIVMERH